MVPDRECNTPTLMTSAALAAVVQINALLCGTHPRKILARIARM